MTSYVDTILVDCNRKGCEEYKTGNGINEPAIFTCKQGGGIKLNPGDSVSVHSAYVNERGNEDNIELTGKIPKDAKKYKVKYTDIIQCRLTDLDEDVDRTTIQSINNSWDGPDVRAGYGRHDCLYYQENGLGVQQTTSFNREKEYEVKDNEAHFSISYYKTLNGEGYIHLPRRFDAPNPTRPTPGPHGYGGDETHDKRSETYGIWNYDPYTNKFSGPDYPATGKPEPKTLPLDKDYWYNLYTAYDGNARIFRQADWQIRTAWGPEERQTTYLDNAEEDNTDAVRYKNRHIYVVNVGTPDLALTTGKGVGPDCYFTGRCRPLLSPHNMCKADIQFYSHFDIPTDAGVGAYPVDATLRNEMKKGENGVGYKYRQDNSRMTIYIKQTTYWTKGANNTALSKGEVLTGDERTAEEVEDKLPCDNFFYGDYDVALNSEWIRYYEIKDVKIDEGYNTPEGIAEQFTDQLNKTKNQIPIKAELLDDGDDPVEISTKQESECYKPFHSATHYSFGENAHTLFSTYEGENDEIDNQNMIDYQSAYHFIGVKRPELWDAGRAIYHSQISYPGTGTASCNERTYPRLHPNHGITKLNAQGVNGAVIVLTELWTRDNVMKYKRLFDAQGLHPELFDFDYDIVNGVKNIRNVNNSRFLHINLENRDGHKLGDDLYTNETGQSTPIFFDYKPQFKDVEYSDNLSANGTPAYGIFRKVPDGGQNYIGFTAQEIKMGDYLFPGNANIVNPIRIGWDLHFNAYGTSCCMLYTGMLNATYDGKTMLMTKDNNETEKDQRWCNIYPYIKDTYIGANQVELGVEQKGKFYLHQLHTPEYIGNSFKSGSSPSNPINPDASDQVYRVNKRLSGDTFCPDMVPYRPIVSTETDNVGDGKVEISNFNDNLTPYAIYDAMSGIFIEDFGISQDDWNGSLWGLLGFSYEQFHNQTTLSRQTRINNLVNVENIGAITTNADITAGDVPTYPRNAYGAEYYNNQLPAINFPFFESTTTEYGNLVIPSIPAITESQRSVRISADRLPVKMTNAYYLIKSDIVQDTKYYGLGADNSQGYTTGQCLPIVGVVNKENGFGDYYFQTDTKMAFTITKPTTISSITTSIHNPDMSLARIEDDTAVIYMIKKNNTGNYNIGAELIQKGKLKI